MNIKVCTVGDYLIQENGIVRKKDTGNLVGRLSDLEAGGLPPMKLHETLTPNERTRIVRVPNGWVYSSSYPINPGANSHHQTEYRCTSVFVPESLW